MIFDNFNGKCAFFKVYRILSNFSRKIGEKFRILINKFIWRLYTCLLPCSCRTQEPIWGRIALKWPSWRLRKNLRDAIAFNIRKDALIKNNLLCHFVIDSSFYLHSFPVPMKGPFWRVLLSGTYISAISLNCCQLAVQSITFCSLIALVYNWY